MWLFHPSFPRLLAGCCRELRGGAGEDGAGRCSPLQRPGSISRNQTTPKRQKWTRSHARRLPRALSHVRRRSQTLAPAAARPGVAVALGRAHRDVALAPTTTPGAQHQRHRGQGRVPMLPLPLAPFPAPHSAVWTQPAPAGRLRPLQQNRRWIFHLFLHTLQC